MKQTSGFRVLYAVLLRPLQGTCISATQIHHRRISQQPRWTWTQESGNNSWASYVFANRSSLETFWSTLNGKLLVCWLDLLRLFRRWFASDIHLEDAWFMPLVRRHQHEHQGGFMRKQSRTTVKNPCQQAGSENIELKDQEISRVSSWHSHQIRADPPSLPIGEGIRNQYGTRYRIRIEMPSNSNSGLKLAKVARELYQNHNPKTERASFVPNAVAKMRAANEAALLTSSCHPSSS